MKYISDKSIRKMNHIKRMRVLIARMHLRSTVKLADRMLRIATQEYEEMSALCEKIKAAHNVK